MRSYRNLIIVILVILVLIIGPFASIWAINTLFATTIAFTFKTWLASLILVVVVGVPTNSSKKD